jgi:hypothetical protein
MHKKMSMSEKELLELKEEINDAKTKTSELTGQQNAVLQQFKNEFGCKTINEAKTKLAEIEKTIAIQEKKIAKGVGEIEEKYNTDDNE